MNSFLLILIAVGVCTSNYVEDKIEVVFKKLSLKDQITQRIHAVVPDDDIQENDYMPDALKELIDEKIAESPDIAADDRIFGGQIATRNGYPHQVGLSLSLNGGRASWCGGSIISDQFILTAAHCLDGVVSVNVMMGAHDRLSNSESGRVNQVVSRANFIVHRGWSSSTMSNDIALIRLNQKITFNNQIQAVTLPTSANDNIDGQPATISGWGQYDATQQLSRYLRQGQSQIASNSLCQQYFGQFVQRSHVCLDGSKGTGTCNGDSGGPLVIGAKGKYVLVGLTSFGSAQGCDRRWPTVYTRVTSFVSWISNTIRTSVSET